VALYHYTFAVNSLAHRFGPRRFDTPDDSRNNWLISLVILGEGWHNNHHRFPTSARHGIGRFEVDLTWLGIRVMAALGLASGLRSAPLALTTVPAGPDVGATRITLGGTDLGG
jgi:stearoyl-CoA desaturase (delta-9 desaturase)